MRIKKIKFNDWLSGVTFDKIIICLFLLLNVGFYFADYLLLVNVSYGLLSVGFTRKLLVKGKLIHKKYLQISLIFTLYALFSRIWAYDQAIATSSSYSLFKFVIISIMLITLLDSEDNVKFSLFMLAVSGLVFAVVFFSTWDISALGFGRVESAIADGGDEAPNVNVVGMMASNSFICFLYFYFYEKKKWTIILAAFSFIAIFFLGSRKSIIFTIIGVLLIFFKLNRSSKFSLSFLFIILIQLVLLFIPEQYFSFILDRFKDLNFLSTVSKLNNSDQLRVDFLTYSIKYFNFRPIFGHGYFNFSSLFYHDKGIAMYSHNNFMETAVGLGFIGLLIYYYLYFLIVKNVRRPKKFNFQYLVLILIILNIYNHFFIVVLNDRFTWMLLPILYAGSTLVKNNTKLFATE